LSDLGFKRKYLQAGFDNAEGQTSKVTEENAVDKTAGSTLPVNGSEPQKKKRKRSKKKNNEHTNETEPAKDIGAEPSNESKEEGQQLSNRKLYKLQRSKEFREKMKLRKSSSEKRRRSRIQSKMSETTCFACREKGHTVRDCPKVGESGTTTAPASGICFRCGSTKHALSKCKKPAPEDPENSLPFATCFVCKKSGHLVSTCPLNKSKGIYPNGGCCKLCGETTHLAKDCEIRSKDKQKDTLLVGSGKDAGADEDDFHVVSRGRREVDIEEEASKPKGKIKRLVGGKFIVRVDDEPVNKTTPIKQPPPTTKVKTVVF